MHRGWETVIRTLAAIDVVVGVDGFLAALLAAQNFNGAVRDDLVGIHIGLGAGTGLPDHQGEFGIPCAVGDFAGGLGDGVAQAGIQLAQFHIHLRRRLFQNTQGADQRHRHGFAADFEILQTARGLRAPIMFGRNLNRAKRVGFGAGGHGSSCSVSVV